DVAHDPTVSTRRVAASNGASCRPGHAVEGTFNAMDARRCRRVGCGHEADATRAYACADQMAVLGRRAMTAEPHSYDLCARHAERTAPPQGWLMARVGMRQLQA